MSYSVGRATAPEGFAGPNDHWHRHSSVCTKFTAAEGTCTTDSTGMCQGT